MSELEPWAWALIGVGVVLLLVALGWASDWTLRRRLKQAFIDRARDEAEGRRVLARLGVMTQREQFDPPGWMEALDAEREAMYKEHKLGTDADEDCKGCDEE